MNSLHKYFEDFSKLFYWLLILTSWLLTADVVGLFFLDKTFFKIFNDLKISEVLLIFMVQIIFILTSVVIYGFIQLTLILLPKLSMRYDIDYKTNKDYYTSSELLNTAVKTNNQTMYNHFRDHKDELKSDLNQKYLCFTVVLLLILSSCLEKSILRNLFENFNSFVTTKKFVIIFVIAFDLIGLLVLFHDGNNYDYTGVRKEDNLKK